MKDTCSSCGEDNAPDAAFCTSCGTYLGWDQPVSGASPDVPPPRAAEPAAAPAAARDRTPGPPSRPPAPPPPEPEPGARRGRRHGAERTPSTPVVPAEAQEPSGPAPAGEVHVDAVPEPGTRPLPQAEPTAAGIGQRPRPEPPRDAPCPECATVNGPERRFCRRCGHQLVTAPTADRPVGNRRTGRSPRWRRLFRSRAPGATPEARRAWRRSLPIWFRALRVAVVAVPLLLLAGLAVLAFPDPAGAAKALWYDVLTRRTEDVGATASADPGDSELAPDTEAWAPGNAVDGSSANAWATPWTGAGSGTACERGARSPAAGALLLRLERDAVLRGVEVLPGLPDGDRQAERFRRPLVLELRTEDDCRTVELADEGTRQTRMFGPVRTETLRVAVMVAAAAPQPGERDAVALTSIRLIARPE